MLSRAISNNDREVTSKEHIDRLNAKRSEPSENTTSLAQSLNQQMYTLFHEPQNFIYELIQNMEDANATSVTFYFNEDSLMISHNGNEFSSHDIERICDISRDHDAHASAKSNLAEKIGYKGIGFKSVFGISDDISILSPETYYFFRFSKKECEKLCVTNVSNAAQTVEADEQPSILPWQIIPIWIAKEERVALNLPEGNKVSFVLGNIIPAKLKKAREELLSIIARPEIILFLKKIETIHYKEGTENHTLTRSKEDKILKLVRIKHKTAKKEFETLWHIHRLFPDVPSDIVTAMQNLDLSECAGKMKTSKATEIVFSSQVKNNGSAYQFIPVTNGKIFCYLPTKVDCRLPFFINASFILSQDRTAIINNIWNVFLLEAIAKEQFKWFGEIALHDAYKKSVLNLLNVQEASTIFPSLRRAHDQEATDAHGDNELLLAYKNGFRRGLNTVPFVLSKSGSLLRLNQCVIDTTDFFKDIDEKIVGEQFSDAEEKLVAYDLDNREALIGLIGLKKVTQYTHEVLVESIEKYMRNLLASDHIAIRSQIICFILQSQKSMIFLPKKIFINTKKQLCTAESSFLPEESFSGNNEFSLFDLSVVDQHQYQPNISNLLRQSLFVAPLTTEMIIKKHIAELIKSENGINKNNSIQILRFIYRACVANESLFKYLDNKNPNGINFGRFKVVTQARKLRELQTCFSSSSTDANLQNQDITELQLLNDYFINANDFNIWSRLLSGAGVRTKVELKEEIILYKNLEDRFRYSQKIIESVKKYSHYVVHQAPATPEGIPPTQRKPADIEKIIFKDFLTFDFLFYEHPSNNDCNFPSDATLRLFFTAISNQCERLFQKPRLNRGLKNDLEICEHFLSYYFREHVAIKIIGTDNWGLTKNLLYAPHLLALLNLGEPIPEEIKLASLPIPINAEIAKILGFKHHVSLEQGLSLLTTINKSARKRGVIDEQYFKRLLIAYRLLMEINLEDEARNINVAETIQHWKKKNSLLSQKKEFIEAEKMRAFDESEAALEEQGALPNNWLHDAGLKEDELRKLAKILEIPCLSKDNDFTPQNLRNDTPLAKFKPFIINCLPAIVLIEAEKFNSDPQQLQVKHQAVFSKLNDLDFIYCDSIEFKLGHKLRSAVKMIEQKMYIVGDEKKIMNRIAEELSKFLFKSQIKSQKAQDKFKEWIKSFLDINQQAELNSELQKWLATTNAVDRKNNYENMMAYQRTKIISISEKHDSLLLAAASATSNLKETHTSSHLAQEKIAPSSSSSSVANNPHGLFSLSRPFDPAGSRVITNPVHAKGAKKLANLGNTQLDQLSSEERDNKISREIDEAEEALSQERKKDMGDRGEKCVFEKIKYLLQTQLKITPTECQIPMPLHSAVERNPHVTFNVPSSRFVRNDGMVIDLIWYNKDRQNNVCESPVDIVIAVNNEIRYFIEVKSTTAKANSLFFISSNEWQYMQMKRERSVLVRASDVANEKPTFEVYKDPFGMIFKNLITFMTGGRFHLNIKATDDISEHLIHEDSEMGCKVM